MLVVSGRSVYQAIRISWGLSVAEVAAMPTATNAPRHSRFLNSFTYHYAIFFELFGKDCVKEGIAARVEWEYKHCEHLEQKISS